MISPLRYPGGKAKLFPFFSQLINENRLHSATYCEPYAGGAGLALKLLAHGFVPRIELNDLDRAIFAFWNSALFDTDRFCSRLAAIDVTVDEWRRQKEIYRSPSAGSFDLGFATYFLNRTSRSGIIEGSGPIGGYEQKGEWKIDARFNKTVQVSNIQAVSKLSPCISLHNEDALAFTKNRLDDIDRLIYLDPPYYVKGRKLYKNYYRHKDHVEIASLLGSKRQGNWIVSYDSAPQIHEIYRDFSGVVYNLQYSAGPRSSGEEVIFAGDRIALPSMEAFKLAA